MQDAPDPRIARAEERLAMLRELSELGMAITRDLSRRALAAPETPEPSAPAADAKATPSPRAASGRHHDPAESFARISRAVRLTLAQEAKAETALDALIAGDNDPVWDDDHDVANDNFRPVVQRSPHRPSARRDRIGRRVHEATNAEVTDVHEAHDVPDASHERLTEGERHDDFVDRPIREAVEAIRDNLGPHPDRSRWPGEGWLPPPPEAPRHPWLSRWAPGIGPAARRRE
jgi:hypothetical protein